MKNFDLGAKSKNELMEILCNEFLYLEIDDISKFIVKNIPKKYVHRLISKLYRVRNTKF